MAYAHVNWQQYSRWGWVIARTMRINQPNLTKSQYSYNIVSVGANSIVIEGNHVLEFYTGDKFSVTESTVYNGNYDVSGNASFNPATGFTTIPTVQAIPDTGTFDGVVVVSGSEEKVVRRFVRYFWDANNSTGSRPWIAWKFLHDGTQGMTYKPGDCMKEPVHVLVKLLQHTVRDLKKTPITVAEAALTDALFAGTGNRRFGDMGNLV